MKKLFEYADVYLLQCTWKDLALVKFCLASIGLLLGLEIAESKKRVASIAGAFVFLATYVALMTKFVWIILDYEKACAEAEEDFE